MKSLPTHLTPIGVSILFSLISLASPQAQERITLGLTTRNGSTSLPYVVAEEKGLFKAEGLNALVVIMQNQVVVNGVLSRHVDYGGTFSNFVGAAMSGAPARIVMSVMDGADHFLVTSPNIKRVEDLKGKTFGISSFGGTPHSEAVAILRKYGLNPEKDVTFLQVGGSSARYLSLESGTIQAAMIVPPFNHLAKKRGFNQLLGFNDIMSMPVGGLAVHTQKMKETRRDRQDDPRFDQKPGIHPHPQSRYPGDHRQAMGRQGSRRQRRDVPRDARPVQPQRHPLG
jgi:NitT/TauT family transport system substrate-binding protein